jgi:carbonic anhydrase
LFVDGPLVCFNVFHMVRELGNLPPTAREVCLHLSPSVPLIDRTTFEYIHYLMDELNSSAEHPDLQIDGWDHLRPVSKHKTSTRIALISTESVDEILQTEAELRDIQVTD